jgi:hypothetical protein
VARIIVVMNGMDKVHNVKLDFCKFLPSLILLPITAME